MFWQTTSQSATSSDLHIPNRTCDIHWDGLTLFPSYTISKKRVPFVQLFPNSHYFVFPDTTILTCTNLRLSIIFPTYPHKLNFFTEWQSFHRHQREKIFYWLVSRNSLLQHPLLLFFSVREKVCNTFLYNVGICTFLENKA